MRCGHPSSTPSQQWFVVQKSTSCPDDWNKEEFREVACLPIPGPFVSSVGLLRWSNADGRFPGPSLVAVPAAVRGLDDEAGNARSPADRDGE